MDDASSDQETKIVALTGAGDYFSSGNDLTNFTDPSHKDMDDAIAKGSKTFKEFVDSLIKCPKILIALVNGPAVGIMVTSLGLFDIVYASTSATFVTPFSKLAQSLEGSSSFTFPRFYAFKNRENG